MVKILEIYLLTNKVHCVKILPDNFDNVISKKMSFQIRKDDRDYRLGDCMYLQEFTNEYTGRALPVKINHILRESEGLRDGYVLLNIEVLGLLIMNGERYPTQL